MFFLYTFFNHIESLENTPFRAFYRIFRILENLTAFSRKNRYFSDKYILLPSLLSINTKPFHFINNGLTDMLSDLRSLHILVILIIKRL